MLTFDPAPETQFSYTPAALLHAVGNSLSSPLLNQVFAVKGIYKPGKGVNYNGAFYDILKDEYTDSDITLVTPERLRPQLSNGQLIEASVYLAKRFQLSAGRIDLLLTLNELFSKKEHVIDEAQTRTFVLLQQKARAGYKDADSFIRQRLFQQQPVNVTILVGQGAIVDQDIKHQVREAMIAYEFKYGRVNLSQPAEIIKALETHDGADILIIARGGGENMAIFDNPAIGETALKLRSIFMTALGHTTDEPLLQKLADKAFITPTALGQYFHELYSKAIDEINGSKAKLIGDLTKQIELSFQARLHDLNTRLSEVTQNGKEAALQAENRIRGLSERLGKTKALNVAVMAALAVLAGLLCIILFRK